MDPYICMGPFTQQGVSAELLVSYAVVFIFVLVLLFVIFSFTFAGMDSCITSEGMYIINQLVHTY